MSSEKEADVADSAELLPISNEQEGRTYHLAKFMQDVDKYGKNKESSNEKSKKKKKKRITLPKVAQNRGIFENAVASNNVSKAVLRSPNHEARLNGDIFTLACGGGNLTLMENSLRSKVNENEDLDEVTIVQKINEEISMENENVSIDDTLELYPEPEPQTLQKPVIDDEIFVKTKDACTQTENLNKEAQSFDVNLCKEIQRILRSRKHIRKRNHSKGRKHVKKRHKSEFSDSYQKRFENLCVDDISRKSKESNDLTYSEFLGNPKARKKSVTFETNSGGIDLPSHLRTKHLNTFNNIFRNESSLKKRNKEKNCNFLSLPQYDQLQIRKHKKIRKDNTQRSRRHKPSITENLF